MGRQALEIQIACPLSLAPLPNTFPLLPTPHCLLLPSVPPHLPPRYLPPQLLARAPPCLYHLISSLPWSLSLTCPLLLLVLHHLCPTICHFLPSQTSGSGTAPALPPPGCSSPSSSGSSSAGVGSEAWLQLLLSQQWLPGQAGAMCSVAPAGVEGQSHARVGANDASSCGGGGHIGGHRLCGEDSRRAGGGEEVAGQAGGLRLPGGRWQGKQMGWGERQWCGDMQQL